MYWNWLINSRLTSPNVLFLFFYNSSSSFYTFPGASCQNDFLLFLLWHFLTLSRRVVSGKQKKNTRQNKTRCILGRTREIFLVTYLGPLWRRFGAHCWPPITPLWPLSNYLREFICSGTLFYRRQHKICRLLGAIPTNFPGCNFSDWERNKKRQKFVTKTTTLN